MPLLILLFGVVAMSFGGACLILPASQRWYGQIPQSQKTEKIRTTFLVLGIVFLSIGGLCIIGSIGVVLVEILDESVKTSIHGA